MRIAAADGLFGADQPRAPDAHSYSGGLDACDSVGATSASSDAPGASKRKCLSCGPKDASTMASIATIPMPGHCRAIRVKITTPAHTTATTCDIRGGQERTAGSRGGDDFIKKTIGRSSRNAKLNGLTSATCRRLISRNSRATRYASLISGANCRGAPRSAADRSA
jgi:hypothetical protein